MSDSGTKQKVGGVPKGAKLALVGMLVLGAAWVLWADGRTEQKVGLGEKPVAAAPRVLDQVEVVAPDKTSQPGYVSVTGSLAADEDSEVASRASGTVLEVRMERGMQVKKGDVLVVLDPVNAQNNLREGEAAAEELRVRLGITTDTAAFDPEKQPEVESAKSTFDLAKVNLERDQALREKNVISQADIDQRENAYNEARQRYELTRKLASQLYMSYQTAQARLVTLRQALDDMTIRAPFTGVIAEKMVSAGESVEGGGPGAKPVARLMRTDPLRLVLTLPEQHVALAQPGAPVEFTVGALPGRTFKGSIAHIGAMVEAASRSLTVEALVDNADGALRPGYFATARLFYPTGQQAFAVPASAVLRQGDVARVFVVRDGIAREQIVTVGDEVDGKALVTGGITADDRVVADASRVSDGAKVR